MGELLCKGPFLLLEVQAGLHAVPIPLDCSFVGMTLCTQAGVQTKSSLFFTNALDVTIGTF